MRRLLALGLAAGLVACQRAPAAPKAARHVVIVTIDTLRADRLGCYGARDVATPRLDRIAAQGALAVEASAHVPLTRPSHVSLFTGLLPSEHGIRDNVSPAVVPQVPLLAELFRKNGFATGAFVSSVVLESQSGLDRGFDVYADRFEGASGDAQFLNTVQKKGEDTIAEAVAWLARAGGRRVFLWLHLYEPHDPYEPPEPYASRYAGRPYDGEVAWTDELVGRFEDALGSLGLRDDTALVVTSDHGEGLGEHDEALHGFFVYQTTLRVPFLVRAPGIPPGRRLERTVRLVDVFPTVLELAGLERAPGARALRPQPGRGAARGAGARRAHDLCRDARAAAAVRLERPARHPRGALQVHPGPAPRALRPARGPGRAPRPRAREGRAGRGHAGGARQGAGARAAGAAARAPPRLRTRSSRSWAPSATSAPAGPPRRRRRGRTPRTRSRSSGSSTA